MLEKFNINLYTDRNYCMHCLSKDDAITFLKFLHSQGRTWVSGDSYIDGNSYFEEYKDKTCYYFNTGRYGSIDGMPGQIILEFSNFDWDFFDGLQESEEDKRVLDLFINTFLVKN